MLQAHLPVVPNHHRSVGVAEDNLRTHVNQFIYEEEAALEHLLVYQHRAACLRRHYQDDRQQVRRQSGPWRIGDREDRPIDKRLYLIMLLRGDVDVIALLHHSDTQSAEGFGDDAQIAVGHILDGQFATRKRRHTDERPHLNHIGQ